MTTAQSHLLAVAHLRAAAGDHLTWFSSVVLRRAESGRGGGGEGDGRCFVSRRRCFVCGEFATDTKRELRFFLPSTPRQERDSQSHTLVGLSLARHFFIFVFSSPTFFFVVFTSARSRGVRVCVRPHRQNARRNDPLQSSSSSSSLSRRRRGRGGAGGAFAAVSRRQSRQLGLLAHRSRHRPVAWVRQHESRAHMPPRPFTTHTTTTTTNTHASSGRPLTCISRKPLITAVSETCAYIPRVYTACINHTPCTRVRLR